MVMDFIAHRRQQLEEQGKNRSGTHFQCGYVYEFVCELHLKIRNCSSVFEEIRVYAMLAKIFLIDWSFSGNWNALCL